MNDKINISIKYEVDSPFIRSVNGNTKRAFIDKRIKGGDKSV